MGNGDAITQKGIGDFFATEHAVNVTGFDMFALHQQLAHLADGIALVVCPGMQLNVATF